ncbi:MAG: alanine racemase [Spirochaetaceae bacterium]|jgi:alanine racemase|nr:alanine racemase [Spirochaetaceae bacterium]
MRATQALIHLDVLKKNIQTLRAHHAAAGKQPALCVPVKADAYGHGAVPVARAALEAGASYLAVATVDEGAQLRESGITAPVLLLSQCLPAEMEAVCEYTLVPLISDREAAALFEKAAAQTFALNRNKKLSVFIKIDTGMGRIGCSAEESASLAEYISKSALLNYAGTITHFAVSDSSSADNVEYTRRQISLFSAALNNIRMRSINPGIVSAANSGGAVGYPESWFDMARPGIILYGYQDAESLPHLDFKPVMELTTRLVYLKTVHKGESVSYGRTWTAGEDTVVGVLPVGYADGLPRILSNNYSVCINNVLYPLAGRVCMDQCMVNLGKNPAVNRWDAVTVFGGGQPSLDASDIAKRAGTIPYEITCNINKRVPRIYTNL